jgi:transposase
MGSPDPNPIEKLSAVLKICFEEEKPSTRGQHKDVLIAPLEKLAISIVN